jgi:hypothetical protein
MMSDDKRGAAGRPAEQAEAASVSRRQALGRLGKYTAPAMVALLLSERTSAGS